MSGPLGFSTNNTLLATRTLKFRPEIEPECAKNFFCLHLNLGAKFQSEIKPVFGEDLFFLSLPEFGNKISN